VSKLRIVMSVCLMAAIASPLRAAESTAATLERATQALVDAVAPGERAVWEHYSDPAFAYVTEDNEVKTRAQVLEDLKPLPPGSTGWILVEEFRCTDFGAFAVTTYVMNEHETVEGHQLLYSLSPATRQTIRREGDHLVVERAGRKAQLLLPESGDVFFSPGRPRTRRIFMRAPHGRVSGFADRREGTDLVWTRLASEAAAR
jgi:hypothetical protein